MGLFTTEIESVSLDGQKHITIKRGFLFLRRLLEKKNITISQGDNGLTIERTRLKENIKEGNYEVLRFLDANGRELRKEKIIFDGNDRKISTTYYNYNKKLSDSDGAHLYEKKILFFDEEGQLRSEIYKRNRARKHVVYDSNVVRRTLLFEGHDEPAKTTTYNDNGKKIACTEGDVYYEYDSNGSKIKISNGGAFTTFHDPFHNNYIYNRDGRLIFKPKFGGLSPFNMIGYNLYSNSGVLKRSITISKFINSITINDSVSGNKIKLSCRDGIITSFMFNDKRYEDLSEDKKNEAKDIFYQTIKKYSLSKIDAEGMNLTIYSGYLYCLMADRGLDGKVSLKNYKTESSVDTAEFSRDNIKITNASSNRYAFVNISLFGDDYIIDSSGYVSRNRSLRKSYRKNSGKDCTFFTLADRDGNPMQYNSVCWSYSIGLTITLNQYKAAGKFDHLTKDTAKEYFKNLSKDPEFHRNVLENIGDALDPHEKAENRYRESIWELSNEAQRILEENESLLKIRRRLPLYKRISNRQAFERCIMDR